MIRKLAAALLLCTAPVAAQAQTMTNLTHASPEGADLTFQLTDGTVLAQSGADGSHWYKLTPDIMGSYQKGTWARMANLPAGYRLEAKPADSELDFMEQIGSTPYVSINVGSGTPQEAAEWLEYMTAAAPTALAVRMADDITGFERRIAGRDVKPSGELRVTTNDSIMAHLMMPVFSSFLNACPDIRLDSHRTSVLGLPDERQWLMKRENPSKAARPG